MNQMLRARVQIRGLRPILFHHFAADTLDPVKRERSGSAGNDPREWERTVLKTNQGQLFINPEYVFGCLREGARHTRKGKGSIQKDVIAALQVLEDRILIDRHVPKNVGDLVNAVDELVYLDVRSVVNPTTKKRNMRYRIAASAGWNATFWIRWDATVVARDQMQSVVRDSGAYVGLGDGRSIGLGRFELVQFDLEEEKKNGASKKAAPRNLERNQK